MPTIIQFALRGPDPGMPFRHADGLRGRIYDWYRAVDPEGATDVHHANAPKPFNIGPLTSAGRPDCYQFEIALLADRLLHPFSSAVEADGHCIHLGHSTYQVLDIGITMQVAWEELLEPPAEPIRSLSLRFRTPTAFHAPGELRKVVPVPLPELCLGNWMRRWNTTRIHCGALAPPEAPAWVVGLAEERVALSRLTGGTRDIQIGANRRFIGFEGSAAFNVLRPQDLGAEQHRWLAALARFATYCGTGVETMRGMGQTELSPEST